MRNLTLIFRNARSFFFSELRKEWYVVSSQTDRAVCTAVR